MHRPSRSPATSAISQGTGTQSSTSTGHRGATGAQPTIIWTHGGAWISGFRTDYAGYHARLAEAGFTVVSLSYPLAPRHRYPAAVRRLNRAHEHLLGHAADYGIDPDRILLAGDSAGAQLSAQLATAISNPGYAEQVGITPALRPEQLRGVILHCGIYDVPAMDGADGLIGWGIRQALWAYTGRHSFAESTAAAEMSVIDHVDGRFPATFISGGNADPLTGRQSRPLAEKLDGEGVAVDELFFPEDHEPGLGHEYQFDLSTAAARRALQESLDFARQASSV